VVFPDHLLFITTVGSRRAIEKVLFDLHPGITEVYVHPAADTPELRAAVPTWAERVDDHHLVTHDHAFRTSVEQSGAKLIGYRELREFQRSER
jgi:hypothetical protein